MMFLIILEIKVALISYSLPKAALKAVENNGLIPLISPLLAVPWPESDMGKQMMASTTNSNFREQLGWGVSPLWQERRRTPRNPGPP